MVWIVIKPFVYNFFEGAQLTLRVIFLLGKYSINESSIADVKYSQSSILKESDRMEKEKRIKLHHTICSPKRRDYFVISVLGREFVNLGSKSF